MPPESTPADPDPTPIPPSAVPPPPAPTPPPAPMQADPASIQSDPASMFTDSTQVPATQPPPGWYPDPSGQQRWWDGAQWGVVASSSASTSPSTGSTEDERGMATLTQVLPIFTGFLGPLIIWFIARPDQPFVKHHAAEALNFQITVTIAAIVSGLLVLVLIGLILLPVVVIGALVLQIMAAIAANRGEWYRFPVSLRLVPGARA